MKLAFVKMHGIGNDFVLVNNMSQELTLGAEQIRLLADRRRGIGCDQLLMVEPADGPDADVRARIFNQDGSESGQCGNGLRCLAAYLRDTGIATGDHIAIEAGQGMVRARLANHRVVTMDMGTPRFEPREIPLLADAQAASYGVQVGSRRLEIGAVSMGNPHAVIRVDDCESAPVGELGPAVQSLEEFPEGVNIGFMQVLDDSRVRLRVFERGVGETLACGSGACAAVAVGRVRGWLGPRVSVALPGGELTVDWDGEGQPVWLTGPTQRAFEGKFEL
jgi:diaminopimelate epimerase